MRGVHQGQYRSLDDSFMASSFVSSKPREKQYLQAPSVLHSGTSPPLSPRVRSRLYVDTAQGGGLSPTQQLLQRLSPQQQAAAAAVGLIQSTPAPGQGQSNKAAAVQLLQQQQQQQQQPQPQTIRASPVIQTPSMVMSYQAPAPGHGMAGSPNPGSGGPPAPPPLPPRDSPLITRHHGPGAALDLDFDFNQSKSFRNLQINFSDGGKMEIPIRVGHQFGSPQQQGQDTSPILSFFASVISHCFLLATFPQLGLF